MRPLLTLSLWLAAGVAAAQPAPLAVSVDCPGVVPGCDAAFFQTETPWARFVRDPADADVAILIVAQPTGGGGRRYDLSASGRRGPRAGRRDTLVAFAEPGATGDAQRRVLLGRLHAVLVPFVAASPLGDGLRVAVDAPGGGAPPAARDPWRGWTFSTSLRGNAEAEDSYTELSANLSASAARVTDDWILRLTVFGSQDVDRFELSDSTALTVSNHSLGSFGVLVRTLSPRTGAGVYYVAERSTFQNYDFRAELAPGFEANLYPYAEATRRQLRFQYEAGAATAVYADTTLFGRTAETYPFHEAELMAIFAQPWGSVDAEIEFNQLLDRPGTYQLELSGEVSMRLFRGLTFDVEGSGALIRNQINLARGAGATDEEVLTRQRELATGYRFYAFVGLSYTFGSAFNPVVNMRFE